MSALPPNLMEKGERGDLIMDTHLDYSRIMESQISIKNIAMVTQSVF